MGSPIHSKAAVLIVAASLVLLPVDATAGTTGYLSGIVLDRQTGAPIASVSVRAISGADIAATQTDAHGNFVFASLVPGEYTITGRRDGYWQTNQYVAVVRADTSLHLALTLVAKLPGPDVYLTSRSAGDLVKPGTAVEIDDWSWPPWPEAPETSDISVYRASTFDGYTLPWSNGFFIEMTPSITFGAGAPVMH